LPGAKPVLAICWHLLVKGQDRQFEAGSVRNFDPAACFQWSFYGVVLPLLEDWAVTQGLAQGQHEKEQRLLPSVVHPPLGAPVASLAHLTIAPSSRSNAVGVPEDAKTLQTAHHQTTDLLLPS